MAKLDINGYNATFRTFVEFATVTSTPMTIEPPQPAQPQPANA